MGDYYAQQKNQQPSYPPNYQQNQPYYPQQQQNQQPYYPQQQQQPYYPQQQQQQPYYPQQQQPPYPQQPAYSPPNYANNNTASNAALNSGGNGAGFHPEKFNKKSKYNDLWAAALFWVHLLGFAVLAYFAITTFRNPPAHLTNSANVTFHISSSVGIALGLSAVIGFLLSMVYFILMERFASILIKGTFIASIIFYFAVAAFLIISKAVIPAIFAAVFALIYLACWFWWRSRIPFATVMLETVTGVTKKYKGILVAAVLGSIVQLLYSIFFLFTLLGVIYMTEDDPKDCTKSVGSKGQEITTCPSGGKRAALIIFSMFSFYWVSQVIKTTVHVTISGVFAAYYFLEGSTEGVPSSPTIGSAKRALTTSFGSICFGSLIIAVINTVKMMLRSLIQDNDNAACGFFVTCIICLLDWIESLVQYFNHYAYTQVAIYGKDFCTAAKDTWTLIKDRGVEAIINDNLIGNVLSMGAIFIGGITAILIFAYLRISGASQTEEIAICCFAFLVGFVMMLLVGEVIESGTATTFVALAEDPQALARTKPVLFEKIRQTYPEVVVGV